MGLKEDRDKAIHGVVTLFERIDDVAGYVNILSERQDLLGRRLDTQVERLDGLTQRFDTLLAYVTRKDTDNGTACECGQTSTDDTGPCDVGRDAVADRDGGASASDA